MMKARLAAALIVGMVASACGIADPSKNSVETFPGSVQPSSFGPVHPFNVPSLGSREIKVTLTSLTPGNAFLGIVYGQPSGNGCGIVLQTAVVDTNVGRNSLNGFVSITGQYCVQVFDPVNTVGVPLAVAQNYTLQVSHP
jgi:hypothetical protein